MGSYALVILFIPTGKHIVIDVVKPISGNYYLSSFYK